MKSLFSQIAHLYRSKQRTKEEQSKFDSLVKLVQLCGEDSEVCTMVLQLVGMPQDIRSLRLRILCANLTKAGAPEEFVKMLELLTVDKFSLYTKKIISKYREPSVT